MATAKKRGCHLQTNTPPYNQQAEEALLGAYYLDPSLLYKVEISPADLYIGQHRKILAAMLAVYMDGINPDIVSVCKINPEIEAVSLSRIFHEAIGTANANYHAKVIHELAKRRRYREAIMRLQAKVDEEDFLQETERTLLDLQDDKSKHSITVREAASALIDDMAINATRSYVGVQTGWPRINEAIVGLCRKHLVILGGYTSHGKSTVLSQIAVDICDHGNKLLLISVEDSVQDKIARMIATKTGTPISRLVRGRCFEGEEGELITEAFEELKNYKLHVYDDAYTLDEIELRIKKHKATGGLDVVAIDFVQNILTGGDSIYDRMSEVAIRLQRMAKKHDVCVLALSQVSEGKEKGSINLRGAQELASAADIVLWIDRPPDERYFSLIVRKNRPFGRTGKFGMTFSESWTGIMEAR
jgi:replicative DNA helicase